MLTPASCRPDVLMLSGERGEIPTSTEVAKACKEIYPPPVVCVRAESNTGIVLQVPPDPIVRAELIQHIEDCINRRC